MTSAVEEAERSRAPIQRLADRLAGYLVYCALGAAAITFIITHDERSTLADVIVAGATIALHADRLAHRQRQAVLTSYVEHILQLPLTFHSGTHSGRLMKVMLNGTDALWRLWLGFFREHFAAILSVVVLLPLSLYLNWRLAILLFVLCIVFTALTTFVVRKTFGMLATERDRLC